MWRDVGDLCWAAGRGLFSGCGRLFPMLGKSCEVGVMGLVGVGLLFFFASLLTVHLAITVVLETPAAVARGLACCRRSRPS